MGSFARCCFTNFLSKTRSTSSAPTDNRNFTVSSRLYSSLAAGKLKILKLVALFQLDMASIRPISIFNFQKCRSKLVHYKTLCQYVQQADKIFKILQGCFPLCQTDWSEISGTTQGKWNDIFFVTSVIPVRCSIN